MVVSGLRSRKWGEVVMLERGAIGRRVAAGLIGVFVVLGLGSEPVTGVELMPPSRETSTSQYVAVSQRLPAGRADLLRRLEEDLARRAELLETLDEINESLDERGRSEEEDEEGPWLIEYSDNRPEWAGEIPWGIYEPRVQFDDQLVPEPSS
jgi:hypothetical protein